VTDDARASASARLFGLALLLFVTGRCLVPMDETDLFFNLRLGEIVLTTHAVPRTNLLSFTAPDAPDVNLAWLFQIVLALAHRAAGVAGTVVLKTGFVVATFGVLFRVALRRGAHPAAAAAALALAAWAAEPRFVERPHLVTFLGLALTLLALERAEAGRPRALWLLVPAGLAWANANSCFFLAPAVLLLYAAGARLDGRPSDARRAALVALALAPLVLATPSGAGALGYIANHFRMPSLRPLQEYRAAGWPLDGPFFFLSAALLGAALAPGRSWRQLLPALALGLLGARRIRFVAEFALLAGPIVAAAATRLSAALPARRAAGAAVGASLIVATLAPRALAVRRGEPALDLGMEADLVPTAAIRFVDDNDLRARMYNDLEVGSYLTWQGWPRRRVFQDPRINGYPETMHAVLRRADLTPAEWQAFLDRFGVTSALVSYPSLNPRAALFAPERWALVYRAADGLVFVRRDAARASLVADAELPLTFAREPDGSIVARVLDARPAASPVPDCEWRRRRADALVELGDDDQARPLYAEVVSVPECADGARQRLARVALGDLALRHADPSAAVAAYAGLDEADTRGKRGLALLALGRAAEALADLEAARSARPDDAEPALGEGLALVALGRRDEARAALEAFVRRHPDHLATGRARAELAKLR
jgi:tetratricopeptide (TPR) repeat protein